MLEWNFSRTIWKVPSNAAPIRPPRFWQMPNITEKLTRLRGLVSTFFVPNTMVAFWGVHLARKLGVPSLLYIHESAPVRRFFTPLLPAALIAEVEAAFGLADRVAFIAAASMPVHARHERRGNFLYTPSWIDVARLETYRAANSRAALRAKLAPH